MRDLKFKILLILFTAGAIGPARIVAQEKTEPAVPIDSIVDAELLIKVPMQPALPNVTSTPVDIDREKPEQPPLHYYDKHGNPLEVPVRFLAELDTLTVVRSGPVYPAYNGVSISANFFDGLMMAVGQQRASFDIAADCSIFNWIFPVVEAGIGFANAHPDDGRCHFKSSPSFYAKVGFNYNFLYKSNPDYKLYLGFRVGFTHYDYDIYDIAAGSEYYKGEDSPTQMAGLDATSIYGQILAGLNVRVYKGLTFGWTFRYGIDFKNRFSNPEYPAWFIPGKGTGPISATFSIGYTFSPKTKKIEN